MIMIIATIVAWGIFLGYMHHEWGWEWSSFFFSFIVAFCGFFVGMLICLIGCVAFECQPMEDCRIDMEDRTELVALKDNFQIEGSAFLFSSVIDEDLHYTYIYETDMGMTTKSLNSDQAYIKYIKANETPYIQTWHVRPHSDFINWLFCPGYYRYTIYLPEGSVIENVYEIDLE